MVAAVPVILGGISGGAVGYAAASALTLGTVGTAVATATGAVVGAALMAPSLQPQTTEIPNEEVIEIVDAVDTVDTDVTAIDTENETGGEDTTINDVIEVQEEVIEIVDTSVDTTNYNQVSSESVASTGTQVAEAAREVSTGVGEDSAIDFYERGRQATILTTAQGLLSPVTTGVGTLLKPTPGLASAGLIS
tara:strand:- start:145 stop:720 length:576 start_codon:yes stop_codon:yes gene_type:complete